eukprot:jgi/Mesvir1/21655/Mv04076-RA.1
MKTVVSTPTVRSAEYQTRVEQLAQDIFTGRELQELRTRIPDIQFVIEEAELYKRNLVLRKKDLLSKVQNFVASLYIYDILMALLAELSDRVRNATRESLIDTDRSEMAMLANALRGYIAIEADDNGKCDATSDDFLGRVYMNRVPHNVVSKIDTLEPITAVGAPQKDKAMSLFATTPMGIDPPKIRVFDLTAKSVPSPTYLLGGDAADDCLPSRLIQQLASDSIDCSFLSMPHRTRLAALGVDFPPMFAKVGNDTATKTALVDFKFEASTAGGLDGSVPAFGSYIAELKFDTAKVFHDGELKEVTINKTYATSKDDTPLRWTSQFSWAGNPLCRFKNALSDFIKRDIVIFNGLRVQILDMIDSWWRHTGPMADLSANERDKPVDFLQKIAKASYALTGNVSPCPEGSSTVWYDMDPSNERARIVDEFITNSQGKKIRNPNAKVAVCAEDADVPHDAMTGGPKWSYIGAPSGTHYVGASRYRRPHTYAARRTRRSYGGYR